MQCNPSERLAVFIDGPNLIPVLAALDLRLDFRRMFEYFQERSQLVRVYYYAKVCGRFGSSERPLLDWLEYNRYCVVKIPATESEDLPGHGRCTTVHLPLALGAMRLAHSIDHVVLIGGHKDLTFLVKELKELGKRVTVCSTLVRAHLIDDGLRREADEFLELDEIRELLAQPSRDT